METRIHNVLCEITSPLQSELRYVLCNFSGKRMQLETFCLTQTCYNFHELLFKGKDEGVPQMDCGVDSSVMYRASPIGGVVFDQILTA